jgi:hypothetical protein
MGYYDGTSAVPAGAQCELIAQYFGRRKVYLSGLTVLCAL